MGRFWETTKKMLGSRKFIVALSGMISVVLVALGHDVSEDQISLLITLILSIAGITGTYVVGQGIADNGKEAAIVHVEARVKERELDRAHEHDLVVAKQVVSQYDSEEG